MTFSPLYNEESVTLPYREEADSFSIERRECLSSIYREESVSPLYREERGPFSLYKRESVSLLYREEADSWRRDTLYPPYREGACLIPIEERDTLSPFTYKGYASSL